MALHLPTHHPCQRLRPSYIIPKTILPVAIKNMSFLSSAAKVII
jgi:hypothetical protein